MDTTTRDSRIQFVEEQVRRGLLVCPKTKERLIVTDGGFSTKDGGQNYPVIDGVPVFLEAEKRGEMLAQNNRSMDEEYQERHRFCIGRTVDSVFAAIGDLRSKTSSRADQLFRDGILPGELCVSIGGGPTRYHAGFLNLNIDRFENVDIVADAHELPWAENSVRAIQCEAVLEHLVDPAQAVREMYRVLANGGEVLSITPFLQKFHAYPNHFNNLTLEGHKLIFERSGFTVRESGVCVGPSWMIADLVTEYVGMLVPVRGLRALVMTATRVIFIPVRLLDILLNRGERAHVLASTTFVLAVKPGS